MAYKKVYLKPGKEESLKRFHPWVFSGAIQRIEGEPEEGEIVDVYTSKKEFIACGHTICAAVWVWPVILQTILTVWFMAKETTCRA